MKTNAGTCPSMETLGAFVDGRLMEAERDAIAEHIASCETCYFVFSEAARLRVTAQPAEVRPFMPRVVWRIAAGLAAAAMVVLAVNVWRPFGSSADARALEGLVSAVGTARTFEPRLTGGFVYAPVRGIVRGTEDPTSLSPDVRIAIAEIEKQFDERPVTASAALIGGDATRAITILENVSHTNPDNAKVFSDLSAAYLVRASRTDAPNDRAQALAMANRALEIDRLMPEALFNRALALQVLGQAADARTAWQSFLTIDDRSGWADEARARLRVLSDQP